jgi:hypothetical protein
MLERLNFLRDLITQSPEHLLKPRQIQVLWECLVNNAFDERERDHFFTWCLQVLI